MAERVDQKKNERGEGKEDGRTNDVITRDNDNLQQKKKDDGTNTGRATMSQREQERAAEQEEEDGMGATGLRSVPSVCICVPYAGPIGMEFYTKTLYPLHQPVDFCEKNFATSGKYGIALARNTLVEMVKTINPRPDYILWVDSDMVLEQVSSRTKTTDPNLALLTMLRLMELNTDVGAITGAYRVKKASGFKWALWKDDTTGKNRFSFIDNWSGSWIPVAAAGMGFMLVRMAVFDRMTKPYFHYEDLNELSEDMYFCKKLREETPFWLYAYTEIKLRHLGNFGLNSDGTITLSD
jgi:hypothetical protein